MYEGKVGIVVPECKSARGTINVGGGDAIARLGTCNHIVTGKCLATKRETRSKTHLTITAISSELSLQALVNILSGKISSKIDSVREAARLTLYQILMEP